MMYKRKDNEYFLYVKTEQSFFLKIKFSLTVCLKCINCMTVQRGHTILRLFLLTLPDKTCFYEKWEMRVYSCITYKLSQRIFLNWKTWGTKRKTNVCFFQTIICVWRGQYKFIKRDWLSSNFTNHIHLLKFITIMDVMMNGQEW